MGTRRYLPDVLPSFGLLRWRNYLSLSSSWMKAGEKKGERGVYPQQFLIHEVSCMSIDQLFPLSD